MAAVLLSLKAFIPLRQSKDSSNGMTNFSSSTNYPEASLNQQGNVLMLVSDFFQEEDISI